MRVQQGESVRGSRSEGGQSVCRPAKLMTDPLFLDRPYQRPIEPDSSPTSGTCSSTD